MRIIGDLPLYVATDSADVWAHPELFKLDRELRPTKVAGVPPDYFSETGQLWGNPIYDWKAHEKEGFAWWTHRLEDALETYDVIRIDHFRGIDRYYEVPAFAENAVKGEWKKGPGEKLFANIGAEGRIIAEDLGVMDEGVVALREKLGFPGMKVLLFAFDGNAENEFLPKYIGKNSVCYTGTHDNDTVAGYVQALSTEEFLLFRSRVAQVLQEEGVFVRLGAKPAEFSAAFCRLALASKADLAVLPVQDILGLDNSARMNHPSTEQGNWQFRLERLPRRGPGFSAGGRLVVAGLLLWGLSRLDLVNAANAFWFLGGVAVRMGGLRLSDTFFPAWLAIVPVALMATEPAFFDRATLPGVVLTLCVLSFLTALWRRWGSRAPWRGVSYLGRNTLVVFLFSPIFTMAMKQLLPLFRFDATGLAYLVCATAVAVAGSLGVAAAMDRTGLSRYLFGRQRVLNG